MGLPLTIQDARDLLGLHGACDAPTVTEAFRRAVKAARPDQAGGDPERFRRVIEAYRLIQSLGGLAPALAAPTARPAMRPVVAIDIKTALHGGEIRLHASGGRRLKVRIPPGLRTGEHLRLRAAGAAGEDLYVPIRIRNDERLRVVGDDLYMSALVEPRLLRDGGRAEIETHAGPRSAWLAPNGPQPSRVRLKGLGLPARGSRQQGHLFVSLSPGEDVPSAAEHLLQRFNTVWTPSRMAA